MPAPTANKYGIQDIWESNLEEEFDKIRDIVDDYPFIGMVGTTTRMCVFAALTLCSWANRFFLVNRYVE